MNDTFSMPGYVRNTLPDEVILVYLVPEGQDRVIADLVFCQSSQGLRTNVGNIFLPVNLLLKTMPECFLGFGIELSHERCFPAVP